MTDSQNRRPPKPFEPPPWERDRFDELARRRQEAQEETEIAEALAALAKQQVSAEPAAPPPAEEQPPVAAEPAQQAAPAAAPTERSELDDKIVDAMFVQLRAEEPAHDESLWKVSLVFSAFSALIGSVLVVWGLAALMKTGSAAAGMIGGSILLAFGGMFVGIGAWMAVRSLKERGVL